VAVFLQVRGGFLGGSVRLGTITDPGLWISELKTLGYRAAYCPVGVGTDSATVRAYADAAAKAQTLMASTDFVMSLSGTMLQSIYTDLPPPDNTVTLDLAAR